MSWVLSFPRSSWPACGWPTCEFPAFRWRRRCQNKAAPAIKNPRATPPTVPPATAATLTEDVFFPVEEAPDVEGDMIPEEDEADAVRAGIAGDIGRVKEEAVETDWVREEAVDEGVVVVEEEVAGLAVVVDDEVVRGREEEEPWK